MSDDEDFNFSRTSSVANLTEVFEPKIQFPLASIRNQHEIDKSCTVCGSKLDVNGVAHSAKRVCKFCYRGICSRCIDYEYYHSETKVMERMCNNCHHKVIAMSEEFENEVKKARLERIQTKKAIEDAIREKDQYIEDRKETERELQIVKENLQLSNGDKDNLFTQLTEENKIREKQHGDLEVKYEDVNMTMGLLKSRYENLKKAMGKMKKEHEKDMETLNKLKDDYNELQTQKVGLMREIESKRPSDAHADKSASTEKLLEEISEFEDKLKEIHEKNKQLKEIIEESTEEYLQNQRLIEELRLSLQVIRSPSTSANELTAEELQKLEERREQIKKDDEEIARLENKLKVERSTGSLYIKNSELPEVPRENTGRKSPDRGSDFSCGRCIVA